VTRDGTTKLLDFGIATLLESPESRTDGDTPSHQANHHPQLRLCTPAYASPEQMRGDAVTAASDVYSLGAVLYELLTGTKPQHAHQAEQAPHARQDDAPARSSSPRRLAGDLDAIVRKAMDADPARRYASVDLLRDDLERHLENRPVSAHPGGVLYHTRKLVARHRAVVAACVLVLMSLAAGLTVTLVQASRARAREAAAVAEAAMRSKYEAAMALHHKGDIAQASAFFREAVEHGRQIPHVVNTTRVDSLLQLARLLHLFERDAAAAEPLYREALNLTRTMHRGDHVDVATALNEYARVLLDIDRAHDAEVPAREGLAMWKRLEGVDPDDKLGSFQMLADILARQNKNDKAEALYREALALGIAILKEPDSHLIGLNGGLAVFLEKQQRIGEAAPLRQAAMRNAIGLYREPHPLLARAYTGMGDHHIAAGDFEEAERAYRRAVSIRQSIHPAPHWRIAEALSRVGYALLRQGRYQEAETVLADSYTRISNDKGAIPESADRARGWLVELYEAWNRPTEAARYRPKATETSPRRLASAHGPR
jgi:eukaryotic-like serine/threonine-protein kinase